MAVKILITRTVPNDKAHAILKLFREMRALATSQTGYISGETLKSLDEPGVFLVVSTWQSVEDWNNWLNSKDRQSVQAKIDDLLGGKTAYQAFHYGLIA